MDQKLRSSTLLIYKTPILLLDFTQMLRKRKRIFFLFVVFAESVMERDRFMSPEEAKEFGIIDKVLEHPPLPGENNKVNKSD